MEKLYSGAQPPVFDCSARLATLDQQEWNLTTAIKDGVDIPALLSALKDVQAECAKLKAGQSAIAASPAQGPSEPI